MPTADVRYDVFISYSHEDKRFALSLEKALRRYRPPLFSGIRPQRLAVFRDESEASTTNLSGALEASLSASRKLLLVCSPAARKSRWVDTEVGWFIAANGVDNVVPVLVDGLPHNHAQETGRPEASAFPDAFVAVRQHDAWAPDFRAMRGRRITTTWPGWFHLLAAIYGLTREQVEQRERWRKVYRTAGLAGC